MDMPPEEGEALLAQLDAGLVDGAPPLPLFRELLRRHTAELAARFAAGASIEGLIHSRAHWIDGVLDRVRGQFLQEQPDIALIAVGGYGRGELHPHSDIDLLFLLDAPPSPAHKAALSEMVQFLWDLGLEIGQSVRSLEECISAARDDLTICTNLIESRLLSGSEDLFERLMAATAPSEMWDSARFFAAKQEEQRIRYARFDDSVCALEPNLKESPGGLRDIQTLVWVVKRHFGGDTLPDLVNKGFLTEREAAALVELREFLWRLRFALHVQTGRHEDRLLFDHQRALAERLGYRDEPHALGVEQMMQAYYRTAIRISRLNERLLQLFEEAILRAGQAGEAHPINARFQSRNGFIEVTRDNVFARRPIALLEVFLLMEQQPELKGVRAATIRLIRANLHRIDEAFRNDLRAQSLFMEILRQPQGVTHALRRMNRYGVLAAYLPAFANIVGRMQYDLFHVFTVDEHTLFVVRNLRRFALAKHAREYPLCHEVFNRLPKPELIYLAGLFHDIAKGRGGDHSNLGAEDAREFCRKHHLSRYDGELVGWLVERHLILSMTAQGQDISDPEVVYRFAADVGTLERLDYLYLLTVADVIATHPAKWNSWKDSLLRELYHKARQTLFEGLRRPRDAVEWVVEKQGETRRLLERQGFASDALSQFWQTLSLEYFLHFSADEIAWHTRQVFAVRNGAQPVAYPVVVVRHRTPRGGTEVMIYTRDREKLFAVTTTILDRLGLNIVSARVETTDDGLTLDCYQILEENGEWIGDPMREEEIRTTLAEALASPDAVDIHTHRRVPRRLKYFDIPTRIDFCLAPSGQYTMMKLSTCDRPGLLALVGDAFDRCGILLRTAKIATIGAEAEDTFFVTDRSGRPLLKRETLECLERQLTTALQGR